MHRLPARGRPAAAVAVLAVAVPAFAALAFAALTGGAAPAAASSRAGLWYAALGDSYTAGPFIPQQTGTPAGCLRSDRNYPSLAAAALGAAAFTDVSCSGATTRDMSAPQRTGQGVNPPQFDGLSAATTLVTLQVGGNDIGFARILVNCARQSLDSPFGSPCKHSYTAGGTDRLAAAIRRAAPRVAAVLRGIHARSPAARILVVGYPDILPNTGHGCWPAVPVAYGDVPYLRGVERELNRMLATEAARNRATYVGTYAGSVGHDACQPSGVRWVEGLVPTSPAAPMHPNALGEQAMARDVVAAARRAARHRRGAPRRSPDRAAGNPAAPARPHSAAAQPAATESRS